MVANTSQKTMNAAIYTRVSTKDQIEGYSLDSQEKICRTYCDKQEWKVIRLFQEQGESAKSADRTELIKLLDYCQSNKGKVDVVLVYKLDRVARNLADHTAIRASLARNNIVLRSATETIDDSSQGRFMENIFAAVAQLDNDVRGERSREGLKEKVRQGHWAWKAPLGYLNTSSGLIVDKEKAPLVQKAFELYAQGNVTIKDLAKKMNSWGLRTDKGKKIIPQSVVKMFQNKLYIGVLCVKKWGETIEGMREKLVDPDLFYQVQRVREGKGNVAAPRNTNNPDFPLRNILKCSSCKKPLTGSWSKGRHNRYAYYHCVCGAVRVARKAMEERFYESLKTIQPGEKFRKLFAIAFADV